MIIVKVSMISKHLPTRGFFSRVRAVRPTEGSLLTQLSVGSIALLAIAKSLAALDGKTASAALFISRASLFGLHVKNSPDEK